MFCQQHLYRAEHVYLLAGDEGVVTKAGKDTYGVDRFSASLYGKPVPGLSFFAFSLVDVHERRAFPMHIEQVIRSEAEHAAGKLKAAAKTQKSDTARRLRGRPQGRKSTHKAVIKLTPELSRIIGMVDALLTRIVNVLARTSLVLDRHFGHNNALHIVRQCGLHRVA